MSDQVYALVEYNSELAGVSDFTTAGGQVSVNWVQWGPEPLLGDINGDCIVNEADQSALLSNWGPCPPLKKGECPADLNGDNVVNTSDLLILFANWG